MSSRPVHVQLPIARARASMSGIAPALRGGAMSIRGSTALVLLAFAGCAVGPDYTKPEPDAPATFRNLDPTGRVTRAGAPRNLSHWWRRLNDALLSELVQQALRSSPDLRLARARLREARARRSAAGAEFYPELNASASARRSDSSAGGGGAAPAGSGSFGARNVFSAGLDASWELDVFGGVRRSVEAAQAELEASAAMLDDTRVSLAAEVARNYVEVRTLQIRLGIARANLERQSETVQLTGWRAQAGLVSSQDLEQARSNLEQTKAQIPSLEIGLAEAQHRLEILLGKAPGTLHARLDRGGALPAVTAQIAVGIPASTLRQRPDVRAAERRLAAETARVGAAEAARYPSLDLSGSIGVEALTGGALGNDSGVFYSLLAGITAPIFNAGRLRNQVRIQDAIREQAQVSYEQTVLAALQEVEDALVALVRNGERTDSLTRAAEAARNAALLARQRYSAGVIDFQSVLDTERSVLTLEDSLASSQADGVLSLIRLYKALGGGWSPPSEPRPAGKDAS